jgi:hypothetical protein
MVFEKSIAPSLIQNAVGGLTTMGFTHAILVLKTTILCISGNRTRFEVKAPLMQSQATSPINHLFILKLINKGC